MFLNQHTVCLNLFAACRGASAEFDAACRDPRTGKDSGQTRPTGLYTLSGRPQLDMDGNVIISIWKL